MTARPPTHFERRWAERGVAGVCPTELTQELRRAFLAGDDSIEFVMQDAGDRLIYRFWVEGQRFYAPFSSDGWPLTVMDQAMLRDKKRARKFKRRVRSATHYRRASA